MVGARPSDLGKSSCVTASYEPAIRFSRTESAAAAPLASPLQSGGRACLAPRVGTVPVAGPRLVEGQEERARSPSLPCPSRVRSLH